MSLETPSTYDAQEDLVQAPSKEDGLLAMSLRVRKDLRRDLSWALKEGVDIGDVISAHTEGIYSVEDVIDNHTDVQYDDDAANLGNFVLNRRVEGLIEELEDEEILRQVIEYGVVRFKKEDMLRIIADAYERRAQEQGM